MTPWTHLIVLQHHFTGNGIITNVWDECRTAVIVKGSKPVNMKKKKIKSYIMNKLYKLFHSIFLQSKIRKLVLNYTIVIGNERHIQKYLLPIYHGGSFC